MMNIKQFIKRAALLALTLVFLAAAIGAAPSYDELRDDINAAIEQTRAIQGGDVLFSGEFLESVGSSIPDWYAVALGRAGIKDNYAAYLSALEGYVSDRYEEENLLDRVKATEWHRISLTIASLGGNPAAFGRNGDINLIADGTYNWTHSDSLGKQGINGWIWSLIALDCLRHELPEGAKYTRDDIITQILSRQLSDGGFSLFAEGGAGTDLTAMAIQALAPYYNSGQIYVYERADGQTAEADVKSAVDAALLCLSHLQTENGDFSGDGEPSCEGSAQVIIALCAMGIDPAADSRFTKNGNSAVDGLMRFQTVDGGFCHTLSDGAKYNFMATEQALQALVATARLYGGFRSLFDCRSEPEKETASLIKSLREEIDALDAAAEAGQLTALWEKYLAIPTWEKSYVYNAGALRGVLIEAGEEPCAAYTAAEIGYTSGGNASVTEIFKGSEDSVSVIVWIVAAAVVVVGTLILVLRFRRGRGKKDRKVL